jgi:hypothetical protein
MNSSTKKQRRVENSSSDEEPQNAVNLGEIAETQGNPNRFSIDSKANCRIIGTLIERY